MRKVPGPIVLLILDGIASHDPHPGNAVTLANPKFLGSAWESYPHGLLYASAEQVGLPKNVKGNSEVGHTNIGAGKIVYQDLPRINQAIEKKIFFSNSVLLDMLRRVKERGTTLHLLLCLSDGNVHASIEHLRATLEMCMQKNVSNVLIHAFTDGRDSFQKSAGSYFLQVEQWIKDYRVGQIATLVGRQFAMDRNKTWERTEKAYYLLLGKKGTKVTTWQEALETSYSKGITDEFIEPHFILPPDQANIKEGDSVFFLNFRPDRAIQLTKALVDQKFAGFSRSFTVSNIEMVTMTRYSSDLDTKVVFEKNDVQMPLGRVLSLAGLQQLRLTESQKFPHVTYFFNGGANMIYPGEVRVNIPSPMVPTFDVQPEMSIYQVLERFQHELAQNIYDFYVINFANGDMVGHTGNLMAGIKAIQHVDYCTAQVVNSVLSKNGAVFITADHGNIDEMINLETGEIDTEHSIFPVPFIAVYKDASAYQFPIGRLADIAPTILDFFGLETPADMTGRNLLDGS
mgnify:CR=1 FL=1